VMSYLTPQQNLLGRLMPRYDLRNPIHFIERLNMELDRLLRAYRGVYLLDTDHIASVYGRRFIQEDAFWLQHHGGLMCAGDEINDVERIEKSPPVFEVHDAAVDGFVSMVWHEIRAAYRTLKRADEVKMVCVDLDDTLWRGLIGEWDGVSRGFRTAGWPLGLVEVLQYLKRRGIMLAIISKNDETQVRALWQRMFDDGHLSLEDFAIIKINRRPKPENIAEALAEANILPRNVVFLDDNPVERAAVKAAFPEIRVIETSHYRWGRVLGWSAELQVAQITAESARRTELIQAQVERQRSRASLSREEFLASLNLRIAVHAVTLVSDRRFARAFELINKTNQFNTTGVRWLEKDAVKYFKRGGVWWTFDAIDRYTSYGLVGVVCAKNTEITQFVMSCRVAGLDAELAALSVILERCAGAGAAFEGSVQETTNNAVSRDIFQRLGWSLSDGRWRGIPSTAMPTHVTVVDEVAAAIQPTMASSSQ
jgi:FkbH-like protein